MKNYILLVGPKYSNDSNEFGGIVVLFEDLISYCNKENIYYKIIDTNKSNYKNKYAAYFSIILSLIKFSKNSKHISLHGTAKDYLLIAPIAVFLCKLLKKKISLRKFAGSFFEIYDNSNFISKSLYNYVLKRADYLFFETKFLVNKFSVFNSNTFWWPNSRSKVHNYKTSNSFSKKYVFISQVKRSKGVFEFMIASSYFDSSYTFDIYGPVMDDEFELALEKYKNISYRGVLNPEEVSSVLKKYDVLVLPTYHKGEGYPGIIIESFSVGLPVISTDWNAIPEIVKHNHNGIIIANKNVDELRDGISSFKFDNYLFFTQNASDSFKFFDSNKIYSIFFNRISVQQ